MTTQRGDDPAAVLPEGDDWFARPEPRLPADDAPGGQAGRAAAVPAEAAEGAALRAGPAPTPGGPPGPAVPPEPGRELQTGRRRRRAGGDAPAAARQDGFDPGDTGTWRVAPGMDGGRRHTTILRYLLGLLAVDRLRSLTRWAWAVPVLGLVLLLVRPRWIGGAVVVLGVLLVLGRVLATRLIARRSLARRYRPVEDDLRAAVEAGKANLRGEMQRVGLPTGRFSLPLSVLRLDRGSDRSKLREVEIHRILPDAQLQRALKVLDEAGPSAR